MNNSPEAFIAKNRSRLKIYNGNKVFLPTKTEFSIELYNPTQNVLLAKFYFNDKSDSYSGLVLMPGERIWLDRFINNNKKLLFDTYQIDDNANNKNLISNNGKVKIEFFKEQDLTTPLFMYNTITSTIPYYNYDTYTSNKNIVTNVGIGCSNTSKNLTVSGDISYCNVNTAKIETGRVSKGDKSNQQFKNMNYDFDTFPIKIYEYQILPESQRHLYYKDIKVKCINCGRKSRNTKWNFCPICGHIYN